MVIGLVGDDVDGGEPLDHLYHDVSGDYDTDGESMIGIENLTVGLVGNDDVVGWIHCTGKGDRHAALEELVTELFLESSGKNLFGEVLHTNELGMLARHTLSDTPALRSRYFPSTPRPRSSWLERLCRLMNHCGGDDLWWGQQRK